MAKRALSVAGLSVLIILLSGLLIAASPLPTVTFTLVSGLPETMNVGDSSTVVVSVQSDQEFLWAMAMPSDEYPGKGVVGSGVTHIRAGTSATLEVTFVAKSPTSNLNLPDGTDTVYVVVGVRYKGGYIVTQQYSFTVLVP